MKKILISSLVVVTMLAFLSCSNANVAEISVEFSWKDTKICSDINPEIRLFNMPNETVAIVVTMFDTGYQREHCYETIKYDGYNIIAKGSLKKNYYGPCPGVGAPVYEFSIKALDGNKKVIGKGRKGHKFPPEKDE